MSPARLIAPALALVLALGGSACTSGGEPAAGPAATTEADEDAPAREFPDTPVGRQARWFVEAATAGTLTEADYGARFAAVFTDAVPYPDFTTVLEQVGPFTPVSAVSESPRAATYLVRAAQGELHLVVGVDAQERIETLGFAPAAAIPDPPTTWEEVRARVAAAAPQAAFLAARVDDGACVPLGEVAAAQPQPLGSAFKLYVLSAVAEAVAAGDLAWEQTLTLTPQLRSWPSGTLQDKPDGAEVTVREAAELMISISDNTATDMLVDAVGREAVEAQVARTSDHADLNTPLLTTKDMFRLKVVDYPRHAREYLALDPADRRAYLESAQFTGLELPDVATAAEWTTPRDVDTIEWFGSATDMCRAHAGLLADSEAAADPVGAVMSINDGGIGLDPARFADVWFKGGSEPGVLVLTYSAESAGRRYVVVATATDPRGELPPDPSGAQTLELLSIVKGAFALAAG